MPRMPSTPEPSTRRTPQAALRPPSDAHGVPAIADVLFEALQAAADEPVFASPVPHGFHSWPAGLHPAIAREVIGGLLPLVPKGGVVDPFCGGGTVGLETILHERPFLGLDLNPLSAMVAQERCRARSPNAARVVGAVAEEVVERSKERVREKRPARADIPKEIAADYAPHTLVELAGLLEEIKAVDPTRLPEAASGIRATLAICFSAILTKVSQRRGDTDGSGNAGKRVGRFVPSERFGDKVHELLERQQALHEAVGDRVRARFFTADARQLTEHVGERPVSLVFTSPPYGGTYDYAKHHAHRLAFLGLDDRGLRRHEIGPRRRQRLAEAGPAFDAEITELLSAIRPVLHGKALAVLVVGDAQLGTYRVDAEAHLQRLAPAAGLTVVAAARAPRTDWRGGPDRFEHLVALGAA